MFKVKIIAVGKHKESWLQEALAEYEKRLKNRLHIEWILVEEESLLPLASKYSSHLIALDLLGESLNSEAFSEKWFRFGQRAVFIIGGPQGLSPEILQKAIWHWSLSPLTFTNQMARLIVVEQLYRALEIEKGSPYHK